LQLISGSLGLHCLLNTGIPNNLFRAAELFQKAAVQGVGMAQAYLGICYHEGYGVEKNGGKAVECFQKAAAQGIDVAQHALAKCYLDGDGCVKSDVKAHLWFSLYAAQEHSHVAPRQNELIRETIAVIEKKMTPAQVAEANKLFGVYSKLIKEGKPLPTQ
jgi:TPR repeat protein